MRKETYKLPAFWASALINADTSGLSDEERCELEDWEVKHVPAGWCIDVSDEPEFTPWHDAPGVLPCECLEFTFQVPAE